MNRQTTRRSRKPSHKRTPPSPEQLRLREQRAYERRIRSLFEGVGFVRIKTGGQEFTFFGRTGELDDIFVYENVMVVVEYYSGKPDTSHLLKKKPLYERISDHPGQFIEMARKFFPAIVYALNPVYDDTHLIVKIVYATKSDPSPELEDACPQVTLMHGVVERYFIALIKTIEKSARNELLKFLAIEYKDVGSASLTCAQDSTTYTGFLLPEAQSSYPQGYKVVSFYADPERLIERCYVLRRDGWRRDFQLYQRILVPQKIRRMRSYLLSSKRVYVNNIIVTLPSHTQINHVDSPGRNIPEADLGKPRQVSIQIPAKYDSIGIIDGQHRVYCYHEGSDKAEEVIRDLRKRQTLLVTGIIYPEYESEEVRRRFEAQLFLEINNNQTRVRSALTQEIGLLLHPYSSISLAKRVVKELAQKGPYKGFLQTGFFDSQEKIKTTSIVSYGLKPLVKMDGNDSLYSVWDGKASIRDSTGEVIPAEAEKYVAFCVEKINDFMLSAKLAYGTDGWCLDLGVKLRSPMLTPTAINGLIVCLRRIVLERLPLDMAFHKRCLAGLSEFPFESYKSSQWQRLGSELFRRFYESRKRSEVATMES